MTRAIPQSSAPHVPPPADQTYQRIAGALLYELNRTAASGLISREALVLISRLQQRTPESYLQPMRAGE